MVSILFALFAYENLDAIRQTSAQRFATLDAIKQSEPENKQVRDLLEPTLTPASLGSVRTTHLTSDLLTIAALWAMGYRRRKNATTSNSAQRQELRRLRRSR